MYENLSLQFFLSRLSEPCMYYMTFVVNKIKMLTYKGKYDSNFYSHFSKLELFHRKLPQHVCHFCQSILNMVLHGTKPDKNWLDWIELNLLN